MEQLFQGNVPLMHLLTEETLFIFSQRSVIKEVNDWALSLHFFCAENFLFYYENIWSPTSYYVYLWRVVDKLENPFVTANVDKTANVMSGTTCNNSLKINLSPLTGEAIDFKFFPYMGYLDIRKSSWNGEFDCRVGSSFWIVPQGYQRSNPSSKWPCNLQKKAKISTFFVKSVWKCCNEIQKKQQKHKY